MTNTTVDRSVFEEIAEKSNPELGMFTKRVYADILRNFINIFSNITYVDSNNNSVKVKCFHANQERSIAKNNFSNITLPAVTISEVGSSNNDERRRYSSVILHEKYWDVKKQRSIRLLSLAPRSIDISYNINIWAKYKQDMDQIREYIFILFNPDLEIKLLGNSYPKTFLIEESDIGEVEVPDQIDRTLKKTITIKIETYIPSPKFLYTSTGKIEKFNIDLDIDANIESPEISPSV